MMQRGGIPRRLPSMDMTPAEKIYEPPGPGACDPEIEMPIDIETDSGEPLWIVCRFATYRGRVVRFALMLITVGHDGATEEVSRIDTCHGDVHRHVRKQGLKNDVHWDLIHHIVVDGTQWDVVDSHYASCLDLMTDQAIEFYRRWKQ